MKKLLVFVGGMVGSYAGWAIGAPVGVMTAFMVSTVLTGVGAYVGIRIARHYEG